MKDQSIAPPPASLLGPSATAPNAKTILAEVRTDASVEFDPDEGPAFLKVTDVSFGALVIWRVDLSWSDAQKVQRWLIGAPAGGIAPTREEALMSFFENLPDPDGNVFLDYLGTYLATGVSHASYSMIIGMNKPVSREDYRQAFLDALDSLLQSGGPAGWYAELVDFLKLIFDQPSSREEFLTLASNEGDLAANVNGKPVFPLIQTLIT